MAEGLMHSLNFIAGYLIVKLSVANHAEVWEMMANNGQWIVDGDSPSTIVND